MLGVIKSGATAGEAMAVGATGGTVVGLLATLFSERPSLKKAVRNAVIGGAGGAAIGGGVNALGGASDRQVAPSAPAPPVSTAPSKPKEMNLGIAALSGLMPGIGPAVHGGLSQGVGQAAASGGASLAGAMGVLYPYRNAELASIPPGLSRKAMLVSALAALGAGYAGNKMREGSSA